MSEQRRTSFINFLGQPDSDPVAWEDICRDATWQGQWIALDGCAYNEAGEATAGLVVDYDVNLAELCARLSADRRKSCSVMFCPRADESAA